MSLTDRVLDLNDLVWQPFAMPLVLVVVGGLITVMTGVVQIRRFPIAVRMVIGGAFIRGAPVQGDGTTDRQRETRDVRKNSGKYYTCTGLILSCDNVHVRRE